MNLHLVTDNVFTEGFMDFVEEINELGKNEFVVYHSPDAESNGKMKYLSRPCRYIPSHHNTTFSEQITGRLGKYKKVFIHYLDDSLFDMVLDCDKNVELNWVLWGLDYYGPEDFFMNLIFDPLTKKYITSQPTYNRIPFPKNPFNIPRYITASGKLRAQRKIYLESYMPRKKRVIARINNICSYLKPDYDFVVENYGARAMYKPLYYTMFGEGDFVCDSKKTNDIMRALGLEGKRTIYCGHSGSLYLNQIDQIPALSQLLNGQKDTVAVFGLAYGLPRYIDYITKLAEKNLGTAFFPVTKFMSKPDYNHFLNGIDVVIMNQNVNVAGTNIFILLYLGKKVYLKRSQVFNKFFTSKGVKLFNIEDIAGKTLDEVMEPLSNEDQLNNKKIIGEIFSKKQAITNLKQILN